MLFKYLKQNKGVTLIELILSLAILAMIVVPVSGFFTGTIRINTKSKAQMEATQLAQQYMERYKSGGGITAGTTEQQAGRFTIRAEVTPYAPESGDYTMPTTTPAAISYHIELRAGNDSNPEGLPDGIDVYSNDNTTGTDIHPTINPIPSPLPIIISPTSLQNPNQVQIGDKTVSYTPQGPIAIKILLERDIPDIQMQVINNQKATAHFYIFRTKESQNSKISIIPQLGAIKVIDTLYDSTSPTIDPNRAYKITVKVAKGNSYSEQNKLAELTSLVGFPR